MDFFIETELKSFSLSQLGLSLSNKVITNFLLSIKASSIFRPHAHPWGVDDEVVLKHIKGCMGRIETNRVKRCTFAPRGLNKTKESIRTKLWLISILGLKTSFAIYACLSLLFNFQSDNWFSEYILQKLKTDSEFRPDGRTHSTARPMCILLLIQEFFKSTVLGNDQINVTVFSMY